MANSKGCRRRFGSVCKLPSGRFQARYRGPDGLMRTADATFATQTDADRWLVKQEAKILDGDWKDPDVKIAFGDFAASWFKDRDYAATTRERNAGVLNRHILPTFRAVPLQEITTPQVRRWRTDLLDAGVGPATVSKAYQVLRAILNTAVDDGLIERNPCRVKSAAGVRTVAFPASLVPELAHHLAEHAEAGRTGLVFVGARGGVLQRNNFRRIWLRTLASTGLGDVHFHDLRHTGNTLAATGGATTRELMQRMGHSSVRAALVYQHLVNGRDHEIADYVDGQIKRVKRPPAAHLAREWHDSPEQPKKIKAQITGFTPADLGLVRVLRLVGADGFEPPTSAL
ncbi:tyrosine-type recombinase/integrase [Streptomyces sp. NPDC002580]|uniref:tyrosine-type recombinase/integrase n=1 Tax=Streptomyces sp. NPDC002580 TaxID=3364653 RepID=UPI003678FEEF